MVDAPLADTSSSEEPEDAAAEDLPDHGTNARSGRARAILVGTLILLIGVAGSLLAANAWHESVSRRERQTFNSAASDVAATLSATIQRDLDLTRTMRAITTMNPNIGESRFAEWSNELQLGSRASGGQLIFFIRQVPGGQLHAYLHSAEADPVFRGLTVGRTEVVPAGRRPRYCLVQDFLDTGNTRSSLPPLVDLCAPVFPSLGPSPYPALLKKMTDTGSMLAVPEPGVQASVVVNGVPVYRRGASLKTLSDRRAAVIGWVGSSFDGASVIRTALAGRRSLAVSLYRETLPGRRQLLSRAGNAGSSPYTFTRPLQGDGGWVVAIAGSYGNATASAEHQALAVLAGGLLVTGLVFLLYLVLTRQRRRALKLVREKTDELHHLALHDSLTDLPNRALVIDRAQQMLRRARRLKTPTAALFMDIDGFKGVNDRFGHQAGDELLATIAARLETVLRDSDTVGRIGGDEFVMLVEPGSFDAAPELIAERVLEVLRQPIELEGSRHASLSMTASIGVAVSQEGSAEDLLRNADVALYEAKNSGRDRYVLFESAMQVSAQDRLLLAMDLREALEADEFFLEYQPTFDLRSEHVVGLEALIRWHHPTRGIVTPDAFIGLAEESGSIVQIGRWVLDEACRHAAAWRARGHAIEISVNVSARQLEHDELVEDVSEALRSSGLPAGSLTLEITETALMRDAEQTAGVLAELKELGVRIAIDDFGTGYSSLAYLRQFPVDELKIDRTFITGLASSADSRALAHTLIQLGKTLGLETLAEGIEEPSQLEVLKREACDLGQGFLFARPLDLAQVEGFLARRPVRTPV